MHKARISADLHIHTCLSPCAELEMTPLNIVNRAEAVGLDLIAICDHNTAENVDAVTRAALSFSISVIPGMEITTREEVHILGLFPGLSAANAVQEVVYENLEGENDEDYFGMQVVANEMDEVEDFNRRFLAGATDLPIESVIELIHGAEGIAIASHVDREGFGIVGQLGFIPAGLKLDALEISARGNPDGIRHESEATEDLRLVRSSDAHRLEEIGSCMTLLESGKEGFSAVSDALAGGRITLK